MYFSLVEKQELVNRVNLETQSLFSTLWKTKAFVFVVILTTLIKQRIFVNINLNYY